MRQRRRPGTYVALSDDFPDHPSIVGLTDQAFRLFVTLTCYSSRYLTDGHLTTAIAAARFQPKVVRELVRAGVLEECEGGYVLPAYLDWNYSREEVEATRKAKSTAAAEREHKRRTLNAHGEHTV